MPPIQDYIFSYPIPFPIQKDADKVYIEWNIAKISINNAEDEWAMVEKHDRVEDPIRENLSSGEVVETECVLLWSHCD